MPKQVRLLLIEPNDSHVELIRKSLSRSPARFGITVASTPREALKFLLGKHHFDLIVTEGKWDSEPRDWLSRLKLAAGNLPIIMLSASSNEVKAVAFMKMGIEDYLVKRRDTLKNLPQLFLRHLRKKGKKEVSRGLSHRVGKGMNALAQNLRSLAELINQPAASFRRGKIYLKQKHGLEKEIETLKGMLKNWMS